MFTGIVESFGEIIKIEKNIFTISHNFSEKIATGDSIALAGMCATVLESTPNSFTVEIMAESRKRTIFGNIKLGDKINLERSALLGGRNSGHFVLGHVDDVGKILDRKKVEDYELFKIAISEKMADLIVFKGSIAVDGISLTISALEKTWFKVSIISHTLKVTTLGEKNIGDTVNLEFDIFGKYVARKKEIESL